MAQYTATVNADGTIVPSVIGVARGTATIVYHLGPGAQWTRIPGGIVVHGVGTAPDGATAPWPTGTASILNSTAGEAASQAFVYNNQGTGTFTFGYAQIHVTGSGRVDPPGEDPVIQNQGGGGDVPPFDRGRD
ncbi:MAG TPA: hypothetical protein VHK90_07700 [Thermoanaerobaculia bacterium]|nr:hypothetical protein [Thermoanaerobaculia bacterium]